MKASEAGQQREVLLVDDDDAVRDALSWLFEGNGFRVRAFESGEAVLACPEVVAAAGCLVLDMRLSGISGLVLFERLTAGGRCPPVLFLTGHADVPLAVAALKMGAADFLEKPFDDEVLLARVGDCLQRDSERRNARAGRERVDAALRQLTDREREVMQHVQIAEALDISIKTVEVHRSRVLEKMGVKSAVELAGLLASWPPLE